MNVIEACVGYDRISCPERGQKKNAEHSGYPGASPGCKVFGMILFFLSVSLLGVLIVTFWSSGWLDLVWVMRWTARWVVR